MAPPSSANLHRRAGAAPPPGGRGAPNPGPLPQSNKISRPGAPILQSLNLDTIKRETDVKEYKEQDVERILKEMMGSKLPSAPLTGIITPRVENMEDRGVQQHKPRYIGMIEPNFFFDASAQSGGGPALKPESRSPPPVKSRFSESDSDKETSAPPTKAPSKPGKTEESSSSDSDESSDSDSENKDSEEEKKLLPVEFEDKDVEESDEEPQLKDFSLATLIMKKEEKTPPTSQHTMDPSPRQFNPTPSPQQFNPTPSPLMLGSFTSPGFINVPDLLAPIQSPIGPMVSPPLPSPIGQIASPIGPIQSPIGPLASPIGRIDSPIGRIDSPLEEKDELKQHIEYVKDIPDVIPPLGPDSESDEDIQVKRKSSISESERKSLSSETRRKPALRKRKRTEDLKSSTSKEFIDTDDSDDSDQRRSVKKPARATSASPLKATRHSPRKPSSVHSTPGRRLPTATFRPMLSESEEEEDSPAPTKPANTAKSAALFAMFGKKAGKGGKGGGKGKGKGKSGGITVDIRERGAEEEDWDRRVRDASPEQPPPRLKAEKVEPPRVPEIPEPASMLPAKLGAMDDDLALSDEDDQPMDLAPLRPLPPAVSWKPNGRPSLLCSLSLSRVRGALRGRAQSSSRGKDKKGKDRWITKSDSERTKPRTSEQRALSERTVVDERPGSARSNSSRHSSGTRPSHRKAQSDRTRNEELVVAPDEPLISDYERKRRDRESSPSFKAAAAKRLRPDEPEGFSGPSSASGGEAYAGGGPSAYAATAVPPAHPSFIPTNNGLMPPPRNHFSYYGRGVEELEEEENVQEEAKRLKHEADHEENMEAKCYKYLQAFMMFSISALKTEKDGNPQDAFNIYNQTLRFIKYVMKPILSRKQALPPKEITDIRVLVMSLRAQSLLNLKLYKLKKFDLKELQKTISDVLTKSDKEDDNSQVEQPHISPTPSPAGSEESNCSKSSGYTSSGEGRVHLVQTPPTTPTVCLSIPKNTLQNQFNIASYLSQCHELWEQADLYASRGSCEGFFNRLDEECGTLTLHSSLAHLVIYTRKGLDYISQELSGNHPSPLNPRSS